MAADRIDTIRIEIDWAAGLIEASTRTWGLFKLPEADAPEPLRGHVSTFEWTLDDLRGTNLSGANLSGAHLDAANFFKAMLDGADLAGAFLNGAQFLNCAQLIVTRNWQSAFRGDALACGAAIPDRQLS